MNDKKINERYWKDSVFYLAALGIMTLVLLYYHKVLGGVAIVVTLYLVYHAFKTLRLRKQQFIQFVETMNEDFDEITKNAVFNMPFPMSVLDSEGKIRWYNTKFRALSPNELILGESIYSVVPGLDAKTLAEIGSEPFVAQVGELTYEFYANSVTSKKSGEPEGVILFYGVDNTKDSEILQRYLDEAMVGILIAVDNFDEFRESVPQEKRALAVAEIDRLIGDYAWQHHGYTRRIENDLHLIVVHKEEAEKMMENRFRILDEIRELKLGGDMPATLSIGVGLSGQNPYDVFDMAKAALDVAFGRGGDQAVVKDGDNLSYYGGKHQAREKRTKVKSRVIAQALGHLMDEAGEIFIMGHRQPDMDSYGACLGIQHAAQKRGARSYIVLSQVTTEIRNIYHRSVEELPYLKERIITPEAAQALANPTSLVIVLDVHRAESTETPALLDVSQNVVLIDHHRRGKNYMKNMVLTYIEPYASSTSELVTEILTYMDERLDLPTVVAEALLAGITVDTKDFCYQTGVRTFEAAAVLKRQGADTVSVKQLFKDDFETIKYKAEVLTNSVVQQDIAIGYLPHEVQNSVLIAAQAADTLLNVEGVKASFVLTQANGKIHISGRSMGDISVQLILEKIGGGGHLTAAAVQLEKSVDEAKELLQKAINEYFYEEELNESNLNK